MRRLIKIAVFFVFLKNIEDVQAVLFKFTKITCESKDVAYTTFEYCFMKELQPNENTVSLKFNIHQLPMRDLKVKMNLMVKSHERWVSFLYNLEIDVCKFLQKRYNSVAKLLLGILDGHSNLNHTCPYNHDIVISNISNLETSSQLRGMPLTEGHYGLFIKWIVGNKTRTEATVYIEVLKA